MRFEVYAGRDRKGRREYRWRLTGRNGRVVASGEGYRSERNCLRAVARIKADAASASVVAGRAS